MKRWLEFARNGATRFALLLPLVPLLLCAAGPVLLLGCEPSGSRQCDPGEDCEAPVEEPPFGTLTCNLPVYKGSPTGICTPYVDAGWDIALVKMAYLEDGPFDCPKSAEWAGLWGEELTNPYITPRSVLACSVQFFATCADPSSVCVPKEEGFPPCLVQSGRHGDSDPYNLKTEVKPYDGSDLSTVGCISPYELK
jgi:hypothetical protein